MGMFRDINGGWECSAFGEFARLVHKLNFNSDVHEFIEYHTSPIPWKLCKDAEPELRRIVQQPIFQRNWTL